MGPYIPCERGGIVVGQPLKLRTTKKNQPSLHHKLCKLFLGHSPGKITLSLSAKLVKFRNACIHMKNVQKKKVHNFKPTNMQVEILIVCLTKKTKKHWKCSKRFTNINPKTYNYNSKLIINIQITLDKQNCYEYSLNKTNVHLRICIYTRAYTHN